MNTSKCRSCGAEIVWLKTSRGKNCPIDAKTVQEGDACFDPKRHTARFATCPEAQKWRKPKP